MSNAPIESGVLAVERSCNSKLSKKKNVSVTMVSQDSCDSSCPFLGKACYAESGKQGFLTRRLNMTGPHHPTDLANRESDAIRNLSGKFPLRLHVVGDTKTQTGVSIVAEACEEYSNRHGSPTWTYTHVHHIPRALWRKVSVLRSCETKGQIKRAHKAGYAAALVVKEFPSKTSWKEDIDGTTFQFIPCPQQTKEGITCDSCKLCWNDQRLHEKRQVITFALHGNNVKSEAKKNAALPLYDAD